MCFSLKVILVTAATYQDEEELRQHPSNTQQQQHLRLKGKKKKKGFAKVIRTKGRDMYMAWKFINFVLTIVCSSKVCQQYFVQKVDAVCDCN